MDELFAPAYLYRFSQIQYESQRDTLNKYSLHPEELDTKLFGVVFNAVNCLLLLVSGGTFLLL